jgi:general secretion pathway protein D
MHDLYSFSQYGLGRCWRQLGQALGLSPKIAASTARRQHDQPVVATKTVLRKLGMLGMALALAGCAALTQQEPAKVQVTGGTVVAPANDTDDEELSLDTTTERKEAVFLGNDTSINLPKPRPVVDLGGDAVMLNFEQAPLEDVVHSILGDTLELDYFIEHPVQGEITLRTRSPVPREELLPILESLLHSKGVMLVQGPNERFFVSASDRVRSMVPKYDNPVSGNEGYTNMIVPLQYISAPEMAEILRPVAPESAFVRIDSKRNLLILAGTQLQIRGWMDIIYTFDVDQLAGMSVGIFPIDSGAVAEVGEEINAILSAAGGEDAGILSMVRVMPVERLSSVLVVSPRKHYIEKVREWIKKLDSVQDAAAEPTLHVYKVQNGDANQIATLLSSIFGGGAGGGRSASGVAPGLSQTTSGAGVSAGGDAGGGMGGMGGGMPARSGASGGGSASFALGENIRVVSDDTNNSLIVFATPIEYEKIERVLKKLDVVAAQVLIEASIIEVTLADELQYGLEWAFKNNVDGFAGRGIMDLGGGLSAQSPGFAYSLSDSAGAVRAVVNALANKSLVNVISTPSVMVLDNHTAAIHVGDQQPIQSRSTVTDGGVVQNSIEYKDTGVKLDVTPSVNAGGLVTLDIAQSVTDVGPVDTATQQRSFLERNVSSRVAIRSGESVVLGGLIRDNKSKGRNGIPLLMDIPVVGNLFSTSTTSGARTELLIFITPRVLENEQDLRDISREMRARMRGLTRFDDLPINLGNEPTATSAE